MGVKTYKLSPSTLNLLKEEKGNKTTDADGIRKRFNAILRDKSTKRLWFPGHTVNDNPIYSEGYFGCNGVALLNHDFAGLSHYNLGSKLYKPVKEHLPELIEEIFDKSNSHDIKAVLIGGEKDHFESNKNIIKKFKIPIIGEYLDYFDIKRKSVVVIPSTQEVLIYTKGEYAKLA